MNNEKNLDLENSLNEYSTEIVNFENFKPDPMEIDTVTSFSVSKREAEELGAVSGTAEEFKTIFIDE